MIQGELPKNKGEYIKNKIKTEKEEIMRDISLVLYN